MAARNALNKGMRIGLVGCVATKANEPRPARDLYVSPLFRGRRACGLLAASNCGCDDDMIRIALPLTRLDYSPLRLPVNKREARPRRGNIGGASREAPSATGNTVKVTSVLTAAEMGKHQPGIRVLEDLGMLPRGTAHAVGPRLDISIGMPGQPAGEDPFSDEVIGTTTVPLLAD